MREFRCFGDKGDKTAVFSISQVDRILISSIVVPVIKVGTWRGRTLRATIVRQRLRGSLSPAD
jgi:hypothetical protein